MSAYDRKAVDKEPQLGAQWILYSLGNNVNKKKTKQSGAEGTLEEGEGEGQRTIRAFIVGAK